MTRASWRRRTSSGAALWLSLLAGSVSLLDCHEYHYGSRAYFANTTREPVKVRVQELVADVRCDRMKGRSGELLAQRKLFGKPVTYEVAAGGTLPLDLTGERVSWPPRGRCAALVQLLGFPDQLVFWEDGANFVETESTWAEAKDPRFLAQSLILEGHGDLKALAAGEGLEVTALPPVASGTAAPSDAPALLGWSGTPRAGSDFVLLRRDTLPDGCLSLELGREHESSWPLFLCAPAWSFPFQVGEKLQVGMRELVPFSNGYAPSGYAPVPLAPDLSVARANHGARLEIWLNESSAQIAAVTSVTGLGRDGRHTACSAYIEPASVELRALKPALTAGEEGEAVIAGRRTRAFVGRADDVLIAPDACGNEHSTVGARLDLLMLDLPAGEQP